MKTTELLEKFKDVMNANFGTRPSDIKLESRLSEDLDIDSLDFVELIMEMEDTLDTELPDDLFNELDDAFTVEKFLQIIEKV